MTIIYVLLSVFLVSLVSLTGVFFLSLKQSFLQKILLYLVSFAVGTLFANVFFHLLPEMTESMPDVHTGFALVLLGIVLSFLLEKCIHWHHCHNVDCKHATPVGMMMLIGDAIHNMTDGILIAAAYLVDTQLGIATTIGIVLHEAPQEIGDFAVLIHSGWSKKKALLANFLSALTAFIGAIAVFVLHEHIHGIGIILLPIIAGNFLYIAGSDLTPVLHKESNRKNTVLQFLSMIAGIALMYAVFLGGHTVHEESRGHAIADEHHYEHKHKQDHHP